MNIRNFEVVQWSWGLYCYLSRRLLTAGKRLETVKNYAVDGLMFKRGRYTRKFGHTGLVLLLALSLLLGPFISDRYPGFVASQANEETPSTVLNMATAADKGLDTKESEKPRSEIIEHEVVKGDTLSTIAQKYNIDVNTIAWQNNLADKDALRIGQKIKILPVSGIAHKVQSGDTVESIAKKYNTNAQKIVDFPFNNFANDETFALAVGSTLIIPDGEMPYVAPIVYIARTQSIVSAGSGGTGQFIWPASGIITQERTWYHTGIDIANAGAPDIIASDNGTVIKVAKEWYGYGWHVIIAHGNGFETLYAHLQRIDVSVGQQINKGQVLGRMGSTGRSTGTHLHFEIRKGNDFPNPRIYLK